MTARRSLPLGDESASRTGVLFRRMARNIVSPGGAIAGSLLPLYPYITGIRYRRHCPEDLGSEKARRSSRKLPLSQFLLNRGFNGEEEV